MKAKNLKVVEGDSGVFAVSLDTPTGSQSLGRLNFDQVVAILEKFFVFKDNSDFAAFDKIWAAIDKYEDMEKRVN